MVIKTSVLVRRLRALTPVIFLGALFLYALWPWLPMVGRSSQTHTIVFYGFSILDKVMTQSIFPAFQQSWQGQTGQRVEFTSSFAGSGTVTNQVIMGVPADLALLSLELDAQRLSDNRVTPPQSWRHLPHRGVINRTPFIILVRPGNPKSIHDFADLARPGVRIVHPDPLTSGAANWAILAEYGAALRRHPEQPEAAHNLLQGIWRNVVAQAASARAARTQFENGFGDALITYEQEALWDRASGSLHAEIVYPHSTVLSEHTLVVIDRNVAPGEREMVDAFVAFLWSETAQRIFIRHGFRSVDERLNEANASFGNIEEPFLVEAFGGWARAKREIIDGIWKNQVLKELGR